MSTPISPLDLQQLQADFHRAIDAWINLEYGDWRELWLGPECALLKYSRAIECDFSDKDVTALHRLRNCDHGEKARYFFESSESNGWERQVSQAAQLMDGIVHGVLAAAELRLWKSDERLSDAFFESAVRCITAYQNAWPISKAVIKTPADTTFAPHQSRAVMALNHLFADGRLSDSRNMLTIPTWLVVRRLLSYLLSEEEFASPADDGSFATEASILLADDSGAGAVGPLCIRRAVEGQFGCYLDPIAIGQTVIDESMIQSIRLAWQVCRPGLMKRADELEFQLPTLRLSPALPEVICISGGSAGGLFACGMYAAAMGVSLNIDASASFVLKSDHEISGETDPSVIEVGPVNANTIPAKLAAAANHTPAIRNVILEAHQAEAVRPTIATSDVNVHGVSNLAEAFHRLTGDAQKERILRQYSDAIWEEWQGLLRGEPPHGNDEDHKLDMFIPPHLGLLVEGEATDTSQTDRPAGEELSTANYKRVDGDGDEALVNLLQEEMLQNDHWLCLTEDAGAGKTVFTLWLRAFLASSTWRESQGSFHCWLAVRCEHGWPKDLRTTLVEHLVARCRNVATKRAEEVVDYALENRRVALILDALDQAPDEDIQALSELLANEQTQRQIRLVLTSRAHKAKEWESTLLKAARWAKGRIELFDEEQQDTYLSKLDQAAVNELIPDREMVRELTQFPVVLRLIRQLIEERIPGQPLTPFRVRGDLYWRTSQALLKRAFKKLRKRIEPEDLDLLQEVLSCIAFEMLVRGLHNYTVPGGDIRDVKRAARSRSSADDSEWNRAMSILKETHLTDRCLLEGNDHQHLSFRSRKMMEFFAGLHLARYAQSQSQEDAVQFTNNGEWEWTWRFAIESPQMRGDTSQKAFREATLCASLANLYELPKSGMRPCELMYHAWYLFETDRFTPPALRGHVLPGAKKVVEAYRRQFRESVDLGNAIASQLTVQEELNKLATVERNFVRCPPANLNIDEAPFWMGSPEGVGYAAEHPRHQVVVSPFYLQSAPVTNAQYELFDPAHRQQRDENSPDDDTPAIYVSWYEAQMFALWMGGRLPTEAEWEYACRAGNEGWWCFGDHESQLVEFAWYGQNASRTQPVRGLQPNAWGLYDVHGNVWEWCQDWFDNDYYESLPTDRPAVNPAGPTAGSSRVLRGGSWLSDADGCRSAYRHFLAPTFRNDDFGFRIVLSFVARRSSRPLTSDL